VSGQRLFSGNLFSGSSARRSCSQISLAIFYMNISCPERLIQKSIFNHTQLGFMQRADDGLSRFVPIEWFC
jgi:hypothetical protein